MARKPQMILCFCRGENAYHEYNLAPSWACPDEPVPDPLNKPRRMLLRLHFLAPGIFCEEIEFGDELQQGRDWRWRGDELIVRRNDGNRCEYPARNIRCVEIDVASS